MDRAEKRDQLKTRMGNGDGPEGSDADDQLTNAGRPPASPAGHPLAVGCLGGLLVALCLTFLWWQLLSKAWADCQAGASMVQGLRLGIASPAVLGTTWLVFALLYVPMNRRWPTLGPVLGFLAALLVAYLWFIWVLPQTDSSPFHRDEPGICPGTVPPWWPSWLPI